MRSKFLSKICETNKSELHCHLGGNVSIGLLEGFAQEAVGYSQPSFEPKLIDKIVYDHNRGNGLDTYLQRFPNAEMLAYSFGHTTRSAFDVMRRCHDEGIQNVDVRFSPDIAMLWGKYQNPEQVVMDVIIGLQLGAIQFDMKWGLIVCCLTKLSTDYAWKNVTALECINDKFGLGYRFGVDVAGPMDDRSFDPYNWSRLYTYASDHGMITTVHAGESLDGDHLLKVLQEMRPKRIGHGIRCVENKDAQEYIKSNDVILEICPSSNIQNIQPIVPYSVLDTIVGLIDDGIHVCVNTDNRTISDTTLPNEYMLLYNHGMKESVLMGLTESSNQYWKGI